MTADDRREQPGQRGSITELSEQECYELLPTTTVGRVAFVNHDGQQLLPLNFTVVDRVIYFRTAPDSILAELAAGLPDVAFEVDYHAPTARDGWNVTVTGTTSTVDDETAAKISTDAKLIPWAAGERMLVIQLTVRTIKGRRVSSH